MTDAINNRAIRMTDTIFHTLVGSKPIDANQDFKACVTDALELPSCTDAFIHDVMTLAADMGYGLASNDTADWVVCQVKDNPAFFVYPKVAADVVFQTGDPEECDPEHMGDEVDAKVFGVMMTLIALNEMKPRYQGTTDIQHMINHKISALTDIIAYTVRGAEPHVSVDDYHTNERMEDFILRYEDY